MTDGRAWVIVGAIAAFGGSIFSGFHFDDYGMLQDPAIFLRGGWWRCWSLTQTRPLTWFSFWLNYQVSGRQPILWHAVNVALHVACALVLYRLLRRVLPSVALFAALLFAVHPMQSEAVDYVYARAILLCTLFSLLAIEDWTRDGSWRTVGWFTLAVLSKEECVTLPVLLALYSVWRGDAGKRVAPLAAMGGISLLAGLRVVAVIQATGMQNIGAKAGISPLGYLSEQGIGLLRYFGLLVFPWFFSVDPQIPSPAWVWRVLAWAVILGLVFAAVRRVREVPAAAWILAGLILLVPSSSIFPAADLAADRRMYLPMIAFVPAMALLLPRSRWMIFVVGLFGLLSMERAYVWASDARLWGEAAEQAPGKLRPILQLSRAVPPEQAVSLLEDAEKLAPQNPEIPAELARVDLELNRPGEALGEAGRALALMPGDANALNNRGAVLLAMKQTEMARNDFLAALRADPCLEEARQNLERSGGVPGDAPGCSR